MWHSRKCITFVFFVCKKYAKAQNSLMNKLLAVHFIHIIDVQLLLWGRGNDSLKNTQNTEMFKTVQFFLVNVVASQKR